MVPWKASLMHQMRQPAKLCIFFTTHVACSVMSITFGENMNICT